MSTSSPALQAVHHREVGGEGQAAVDHVLLEDALEAPGDHQLDAGALMGDHRDLAAGARAVGVAADDDLEAAALDAVLDHDLLEALEEVRAEDVAGVAEGAGGAVDHCVGVDREVQGWRILGVGREVLAGELRAQRLGVFSQPEDASAELHRRTG
jgi:hypothetical protein